MAGLLVNANRHAHQFHPQFPSIKELFAQVAWKDRQLIRKHHQSVLSAPLSFSLDVEDFFIRGVGIVNSPVNTVPPSKRHQLHEIGEKWRATNGKNRGLLPLTGRWDVSPLSCSIHEGTFRVPVSIIIKHEPPAIPRVSFYTGTNSRVWPDSRSIDQRDQS